MMEVVIISTRLLLVWQREEYRVKSVVTDPHSAGMLIVPEQAMQSMETPSVSPVTNSIMEFAKFSGVIEDLIWLSAGT